jgi:hypothetical protein
MANYVTWSEADSIITDSRWLALTIEEKEKFIHISTLKIDSLPYARANLRDNAENVFPWTGQTKVPQIVKTACTYEALGSFKTSIGDIDVIALKQSQGIVSESTQSASVSFNQNKKSLINLDMFQGWGSKEAVSLIYPFTTKSAEVGRARIWDWQTI